MDYTELLGYIVAALAGYEYEIDKAIDHMGHYRCPLSSASEEIMNRLDDAVRDYCSDNDIDYYNFNVEDAFGRELETIFFDALTEMDYYENPCEEEFD